MDVFNGPNSLEIYHIGPPQSAGPLPTVFYLALSGSDSLLLDPFNQFVQFLEGLPLRIFSFTLPGHGPGQKKEDAIHFAIQEFSFGRDPFAPFLSEAKENIQYLVDENWIDQEKMAIAGLSRGGFFAALLAKEFSKIKTIIGFAPITDPTLLIPETKSYSLFNHIDLFTEKHIRIYVGNRDERISTNSCFHFIREIADRAHVNGIRSPQAELIISPSIGYMGHGTSPATFLNGANFLKEKLSLV